MFPSTQFQHILMNESLNQEHKIHQQQPFSSAIGMTKTNHSDDNLESQVLCP